jgi:adenylate cyclase
VHRIAVPKFGLNSSFVNIGDVVYDEARIYGDGINVAARLESIAEPGEICISSKVYDEILGRIDSTYEDMGEQQLKNIARPVRTYRLRFGRKHRPLCSHYLRKHRSRCYRSRT